MFSSKHLIESPCNALLGIAQKFILSRVLMIFAELRLGKLLENGPLSLFEIATSLKVHPDALKRFLRLLTAHHIIRDLGNDVFDQTPISQYFDKILSARLVDDYNGLDIAMDTLIHNRESWSHVFSNSLSCYLNKYLLQPAATTPEDDLLALAHEFILAKVVMSAAELKLGTIIKANSLSLNEISAQMQVPPDILKLLLQILVKHDIVEETEPDVFASTPLSQCFDRILSPHILDGYKLFNGAMHTLQTNSGSWEHVFGKSFYEYLNQDDKKLQMFKEWCVRSAIDWLPPILSLCNFPTAQKLVDVGGGGGHFITSVLMQNPHMEGILFDQPSVVSGADKNAIFKCLNNRISFAGGDFFQSVPKGGDVYTICRTLLNWSDEQSIEIINNCHTALNGRGKLWIIDFLVPDPSHPKYPRAVINDISLFTIFNSAIRTEEEWRNLIAKTLFTVSNIFITQEDIKPEPYYPMCIIEALPKEQLHAENNVKQSTEDQFKEPTKQNHNFQRCNL